MTNYKVSNLSSKTTTDEQGKLEKSLKAMRGVEKVALHPDKSEISISFRQNQEPKKGELETAIKSAGFTLGTAK